ncbi:MAG: hypothetical protein H7338_21810 [Candidatus Sericytochromatia bacterium]|nr:hypothetical protein [Candidatus Sericytochromatia bacterium]
MRAAKTLLLIGTLLVAGCTQPTVPTSSDNSGIVSGTMVIPGGTDPSMAVAPTSLWQLAQGIVVGSPAWAPSRFDETTLATFNATIDGRPVRTSWDRIETTTAGDTRAQFTLTGIQGDCDNAELIFSSPSNAIRLGTYIDRIQDELRTPFDATTKFNLKHEINARTTSALLVARSMAEHGGRALSAYNEAEFQAVVNSQRTREVEASLISAFAAQINRGHDVFRQALVARITADVATALRAQGLDGVFGSNLTTGITSGLGLMSNSTSGGSSTGTSTATSTTVTTSTTRR